MALQASANAVEVSLVLRFVDHVADVKSAWFPDQGYQRHVRMLPKASQTS